MNVLNKYALSLIVISGALTACGGGGGGGGGLAVSPATSEALAAGATGTTATGSTAAGSTATGSSASGASGSSGSSASGSSGATGGTLSSNAVIAPPAAIATGDAVFSSSGTFSASAYQATAAQMSTAAGIDYRYGPSPTAYGTTSNTGRSNLQPLTNNSYSTISTANGGDRSCSSWCGTWQVGGPAAKSGGDYSSSVMQVAWVPDAPATYAGLANLQAASMSNNAFAQKPEPSWTTYANSTDGAQDFSLDSYKSSGVSFNNVVTVGRCYRSGWCDTSLSVYQNGAILTTGSNTARNHGHAQLDANKVPTAIAITNGGEFALVTVWDTAALKGQVAVLALAGLCDGCDPSNSSGWYNNWGEWGNVYPGLPNLGNVAYIKLLGYVDLPSTMKAPTEISASTGMESGDYDLGGSDYYSNPLSSQSNRTAFYSGSYAGNIAQGGMAVVISKSEQQAAFIDLRPLFSYYRQQYFNVSANSQSNFNSMISGRGPGAGQWPYTFTNTPSQSPVVVKTVALGNRPTAVRVSMTDNISRAWIATQEGTLHMYNLGSYLSTSTAGSPASIAEIGSGIAVGRNPTNIAYAKKGQTSIYPVTGDREVIVTSRGDRRINWVRFAADYNSGAVRTDLVLTDSNLVDPIAVEDNDNHGTESYILSVADYTGRKVSNYRYGPTIFWTNTGSGNACQPNGGCTVSGNTGFEYGGSFALPGGAFQVVDSNTP